MLTYGYFNSIRPVLGSSQGYLIQRSRKGVPKYILSLEFVFSSRLLTSRDAILFFNSSFVSSTSYTWYSPSLLITVANGKRVSKSRRPYQPLSRTPVFIIAKKDDYGHVASITIEKFGYRSIVGRLALSTRTCATCTSST